MNEPIEIDISNCENLLKILENKDIEINIRLAALDQIIEIIPIKNHFLNNFEQFFKKLIVFICNQLRQYLQNIEKLGDFEMLYFGKLLTFLNIFIIHCNFSINLKREIMNFFKNEGFELLKPLISHYFNIKSLEIRFQISRFIYIIFFNMNEILQFLDFDSKGIFFINPCSSRFFQLSEGDVFERNEEKEMFWKDFYPLNEFAQEYVEKVVGLSEEKEEFFEKTMEEMIEVFMSKIQKEEDFMRNIDNLDIWKGYFKAFSSNTCDF